MSGETPISTPRFSSLSFPVKLLETTWPAVVENLATDEALLQLTDDNPEQGVLRIWESPENAVILGRSNRFATETHPDACAADAVPIYRRCSGGGTVAIGPGCLMYSLILPLTEDWRQIGIRGTTSEILHRVASGLESDAIEIEVQGISDLVFAGRKFSGNSQRWLRNSLLHHGTILYNYDLSRVSRWLKFPSLQPEYRQSRLHEEFITNLPLSSAELRQRLISAWNATGGSEFPSLNDRVAELMRNRYSRDDWHRER